MHNLFIFDIDFTELKYLQKQTSLNVFREISISLSSTGRAYVSKRSHMLEKIVIEKLFLVPPLILPTTTPPPPHQDSIF